MTDNLIDFLECGYRIRNLLWSLLFLVPGMELLEHL